MAEQDQQGSGQKWGTQWTSRSDAALAQERAETRAASEKVTSRSESWRNARASKMVVAWFCIGSIALTILVGFQWAGWQTAKGAADLATVAADAAVVKQLAPICVAQFNLDPERAQKLVALKASSTYQRAGYVTDQNWATMPGVEKPVKKVAEACALLLMDVEN